MSGWPLSRSLMDRIENGGTAMVVLRLGTDRTSAGAGDGLRPAVAIAVALVAAVAAFTIAAGVTNSLVAGCHAMCAARPSAPSSGSIHLTA